jgi:hypothetical protein
MCFVYQSGFAPPNPSSITGETMFHKLKYFAVTLALFLALGVFLERPAYAYVDPGSSLLVFQSISAMITGALFYFRRRLKALITRTPVNPANTREK